MFTDQLLFRSTSRRTCRFLAVAVAACIAAPAVAQDVVANGIRIELTSWLTAKQRDFVLTLPELRRDRQYVIQALLKQRVYWGEFDLDGDGIPERIVMIGYGTTIKSGADCIKTKCATMILKQRQQGWELDSEIDANRSLLRALPETDRGWRRIYAGPESIYNQSKFGYILTTDIRNHVDYGRPPLSSPAELSIPAQKPPLIGTRVEFTNGLTTAQRNFIRTHPGFQWMHRLVNEAIFKKWIYWAEFDLNDDGILERIIIVEDGSVCGTAGCDLTVLRWEDGKWHKDSGISGVHEYFVVLPETDAGWHRLDNGDEILSHFRCGYYSQSTIEEASEDGLDPCSNQ